MSQYVQISSPQKTDQDTHNSSPRTSTLSVTPMDTSLDDKEKGLMDIQPHLGGYLKGPIILQTTVMYAFFILVVASAQVLEWAPYIRIANFIPYVIICLILLEVTRIFQFRPSFYLIFPFYTTIIPYGYLCIFSREAHILVSLLFFCAVLSIFLQSGLPQLHIHVLIYTIAFGGVYLSCVAFMGWFYTDTTGVQSLKGRALSPAISWAQEITFIVSIALLGIAFLMLEKFVKLYANSLLERSRKIKTLEKEKQELAEEVKKFKGDDNRNVDLDAPVQKVIQTLQTMANSSEMNIQGREQLQIIIKILASNALYSPDLDQNVGDSEIVGFLEDMLNKSDQKNSSKLNSGTAVFAGKGDINKMVSPMSLEKGVEMQVQALLERIDEWDFNVTEVAELTNGRPLFFIAFALFTRHDLLRKFNIDETKFKRFLTVVESGYDNRNPYHNSTHASDVLQTLNFFITKGGLSQYVTDLDILAALTAAVIHDFEHPGLNNAFHINTQSELAIRYNDKSVLENYHCAAAYQLMNEEQNNIMSGLTEAQRKEVRESIVAMVLATDMAQHFDLLGKFKSKLAGNGFDPKDRKDRLLLLQIAIKCADISNPTKPTFICNLWAGKVMEEFYQQGDEERKNGMAISAFMDRTKPAVAKCQLGFIDFIVGPLFEVWVNFLPDMGLCLVHLEQNRAMWKKRNLPTETHVFDAPPSAQKKEDPPNEPQRIVGSVNTNK